MLTTHFVRMTKLENRQKLAISGSILLIVGVFLPILSVPIIGSIDYFKGGEGDGVIVLILGVISLVLSLTKKYKVLLVTSSLSLSVMLFTVLGLIFKLSEIKSEYAKEMEGNPFAGLGQLAMETIRLEWGWFPLISGAVVIIISVFMQEAEE